MAPKDSSFGEWGYPELVSHTKKWKEYDAVSRLDAKIFKINPHVRRSGKKHMLFLGGSNTLGEEVKEIDSIEALISRTKGLEDYRPYILGYSGWGPNNILGYFRALGIKGKLKQQEGVAIFQFLHDHHSRVCGEDHYFSWNFGKSPNYEKVGDDFYFHGMFRDSFKFKFFKLKLGLRQFIPASDNPPERIPIKLSCRQTVVAVMKMIKSIYLEAYPRGKFYVLTFPAYSKDKFLWENYTPTLEMLKRAGIEVLNPVNYYKNANKENNLFLTATGHVTGEYHQLMMPFFQKTFGNNPE